VANGAVVKATRQPKESTSFELFMLNGVSNHYVSHSLEGRVFYGGSRIRRIGAPFS
jgi:hypothetical protein